MLRIGYVFDTDLIGGQATLSPAGQADRAALEAAGCNVVRIETGVRRRTGYGPVLQSVLEFAGPGDEVLIMRADQIANSASAILHMVQTLQDRNVLVRILESGLSNQGDVGETLIKTLKAVSSLETQSLRRLNGSGRPGARNRTDADEILSLKARGLAATEIASTLGVSRMTIWRKLKQLSNQTA
jgi:DNA invertase Pin-like site-specific DNA recombinase